MYLFIYLQSELHASYEFNIIKTNKKQKDTKELVAVSYKLS